MSWQGEMVTMLRYIINDIDSTDYTYSSDRLETILLVSAQMVCLEMSFENTYTIDVEQCYLSPDPTDPSTGLATANKDDAFINLVVLKAAVFITGSELKTYSLSAVTVTDGPSTVNYSAVASNMKNVYDNVLKQYEEYKFNYISGVNSNGHVVLGPYSPGSDVVRYSYRDWR